MKILVNAYSVCPGKGSEPGVGWNWVSRMARTHELHVITEAEFQADVERELDAVGLRGQLVFHYLDIGETWRRRCWNQGDWRFYLEYARWQRRALSLARNLCSTHDFDLVHQLNMVGYREPGLLWKLPLPFVWGPAGGAGNVRLSLLEGQPAAFLAFNAIKNLVNRIQLWNPHCKAAARRSGIAFFATTAENAGIFARAWGTPRQHIEEVGPLEPMEIPERAPRSPKGIGILRIAWLGHFDSRKALQLLLGALERLDLPGIELHVMGTGALESAWKTQADRLRSAKVHWLGRVDRKRALSTMASCDIVSITSLKEENSSVTFEALSLGTPVVCFALSGMDGVVDDGCGRVVPVTDLDGTVANLAGALAELHAMEDLSELSRGALARAETLSWSAKMAMLESLYRKRLTPAKVSRWIEYEHTHPDEIVLPP